MDEQVQEWVKKKLQRISEGETVLSQSIPEEPEKVEKEMTIDTEIEKQTPETKKQPDIKQQLEIKQRPKAEQPVNGSVNVEEKISEYVQEIVAEKPKVEQNQTEQKSQIKEKSPVEKPKYSEGFSMPKISKIPKFPKMPKLLEPKLDLLTKRKILIMIISSVAGLVAGYLVFLFLII